MADETAEKSLPERHAEQVFRGKIELDVRDSVPDWGPYLPPIAPRDAPNVLFVLIWSAPSEDEIVIFEHHDFTVGGTDTFLCGLKEAPNFAGTTRYHAIIDGETMVFSEHLTDLDDDLLAVSLVTWTVTPDNGGSKLTIIDQVTSLHGDGPIHGSRHGYTAMLDQLQRHLDQP